MSFIEFLDFVIIYNKIVHISQTPFTKLRGDNCMLLAHRP